MCVCALSHRECCLVAVEQVLSLLVCESCLPVQGPTGCTPCRVVSSVRQGEVHIYAPWWVKPLHPLH